MVRTFEVEEEFAVRGAVYRQLVYGDEAFRREFHLSRGDQDVDVSEWIDEQRVCFYSMEEKEGGGQYTRVLETERLEWRREAEGGEGAEAEEEGRQEGTLHVHCAITPENPLGNVFKIAVEWIVETRGEKECRVTAKGRVECTARAWGLQRVAEGYLQAYSEKSVHRWLAQSRRKVEEYIAGGGGAVRVEQIETSDSVTSQIRLRAAPEGSGDGSVGDGSSVGGVTVEKGGGEPGGSEEARFSVQVERRLESYPIGSGYGGRVEGREASEDPDFPWIMVGWLVLVTGAGLCFWWYNSTHMF